MKKLTTAELIEAINELSEKEKEDLCEEMEWECGIYAVLPKVKKVKFSISYYNEMDDISVERTENYDIESFLSAVVSVAKGEGWNVTETAMSWTGADLDCSFDPEEKGGEEK